MANSYTLIKAKIGDQIFAVPFPYLDQQDVNVFLNGIPQHTPADYVWLNAGQIKLIGSLIADTDVLIQRQTSPNAVLATFNNGAVLTAAQLNIATLQNFYLNQETQDALDEYITGGLSYANGGLPGDMTAEDLINAVTSSILNSALLAQLNQSLTDISSNGEAILSLSNTVNTMQTTVDALSDLGSELGGLSTWVMTEQTQRIAGDAALAQELALVGAVSADNLAFVLNQSTVMVDPTTSLADYISGVDSQFDSVDGSIAAVQASITNEATTRASADSALSTNITNLSATVTALTGTVGSNFATLNSLISTTQSTLATNYSTTASMQTYVGSQIQTATTSLTAAIAETYATQATLDGIASATYTLQVDVNGNIAGFGLMNDGSTSQFIVQAAEFAIVDTTGGTKVVPFAVSGGQVFMQSVVIHDAIIDSLQIGKLTQGTLNADLELGTGHIIMNNGAYLKIEGQGFGSSNQFIEWYGPLIAGKNWNNGTGQPIYGGFQEKDAVSYQRSTGELYVDHMAIKGYDSGNWGMAGVTLNNFNFLQPEVYVSSGQPVTITVTVPTAHVTIGSTFPAGSAGAVHFVVERYNGATGVWTEVGEIQYPLFQGFTTDTFLDMDGGSRSIIDSTPYPGLTKYRIAAGNLYVTTTISGHATLPVQNCVFVSPWVRVTVYEPFNHPNNGDTKTFDLTVAAGSLTVNGTAVYGGIPIVGTTTAATAQRSWLGQMVVVDGSGGTITIPSGIFNPGDMFYVLCDAGIAVGAFVHIVGGSGMTVRWSSGASNLPDGSHQLRSVGMAMVWFRSASECYVNSFSPFETVAPDL